MKLTLNRSEETNGHFLDVNVEFSDEEKQFILTKGGQYSYRFESLDNLIYVERELTENAKKLDESLEIMILLTSDDTHEMDP